ncbi:MAG TPA: FAD-dependent oxidoreductase [Acidobacteriota bacterium]|nr:FAD-dependent oxidoreductase [Acidobacteriota bacterium]
MKDPGRLVIIGAGPTGLGAAFRLEENGFDRFLVVEAKGFPGGLATSYRDNQGFTWDVGGHVQFSHYSYYDDVLDLVMPGEWLSHNRSAWVWTSGCFIPYPFQYNLRYLPEHQRQKALEGLQSVADEMKRPRARNFAEWIEATYGKGLAEIFLYPYNKKVWGYPLETLDSSWVGERVPPPDPERIRRSLAEGRDDDSWGPNSSFRFPQRGGTGAIWKAVAATIHPSRLLLDTPVDSIDTQNKRLTLQNGSVLTYDHLITTIPLDVLCFRAQGLESETKESARQLISSACHIVGIGLRGPEPKDLDGKCWIYFPDANSPYYRVTVFSRYSPENVPQGEEYWSLMAEVCESPFRPVDHKQIESQVITAMAEDGLITNANEVVSVWHRRESHGYPTPFLGRDQVLDGLLPALEKLSIFSRGRFGAWKYEVSNQDHSFMQGVELVDRLLGNGEEVTLNNPDLVNSGRFCTPKESS